MKRLAIIPARGGSKRIPNKNVRDFCGQPIITHVITSAKQSGLFDVIHVSTDCNQIATIASKAGLNVPFMRPARLAEDHTPIMPVLKYVLEKYVEQGITFDTVALIMACAPMITKSDLRGAVAMFDAHHGQLSILGVAECPCPVEWTFHRRQDNVLVPTQPGMFSIRSQDLLPAFYDAGQFCFMSSHRILLSEGAGSDEGFLGYPLSRYQAIDIDTLEDWQFAEYVFKAFASKLTGND